MVGGIFLRSSPYPLLPNFPHYTFRATPTPIQLESRFLHMDNYAVG